MEQNNISGEFLTSEDIINIGGDLARAATDDFGITIYVFIHQGSSFNKITQEVTDIFACNTVNAIAGYISQVETPEMYGPANAKVKKYMARKAAFTNTPNVDSYILDDGNKFSIVDIKEDSPGLCYLLFGRLS